MQRHKGHWSTDDDNVLFPFLGVCYMSVVTLWKFISLYTYDQYIFLTVRYTSEPQPSVPVDGAKGNQWPCLGLEEVESKGRIQKWCPRWREEGQKRVKSKGLKTELGLEWFSFIICKDDLPPCAFALHCGKASRLSNQNLPTFSRPAFSLAQCTPFNDYVGKEA